MSEGSTTSVSEPSMPDPTAPRSLTRELLGPVGTPTAADHASFVATVRGIPRVLADLVVPAPGGGPFRLTDYHVRSALDPEDSAVTTPFTWSARTARRSLGLQAVRSLVAGEARSPIEGVRMAVAAARRGAANGAAPASTMDQWLTKLSSAGLSAVEADAVTWATRLWCGLDWEAFEEPPIIGRDRWWDSPHSSLLAIRSRAEVRALARDATGVPFSVHLVVLGGPRRPTIRSELSVVAMVETLQAPRSLPPARIVGWWPDSGHLVKIDVDGPTLDAGVRAIACAVARMGGAPHPCVKGATKAAA
jgi:hypothetical protein